MIKYTAILFKFYTFYESYFSRVRHPSNPGRGYGSLTCHMTQFERSDWLRSANFINIMIKFLTKRALMIKQSILLLSVTKLIAFARLFAVIKNHISCIFDWQACRLRINENAPRPLLWFSVENRSILLMKTATVHCAFLGGIQKRCTNFPLRYVFRFSELSKHINRSKQCQRSKGT